MKTKSAHRLRSKRLAIVAGAITAAACMSAPAAIGAQPGDLCQVNTGGPWTVITNPEPWYTLSYPQYFRVVDYGSPDTYYGHGNGKPNGYMVRAAINQATCS